MFLIDGNAGEVWALPRILFNERWTITVWVAASGLLFFSWDSNPHLLEGVLDWV